MKILENLGVDLTSPSTIATFSAANQGKSTLMTYFVKELHDNGKTISIISDESDETWVKRLRNIGCEKGQQLIYKQLPYESSVFDYIKEQKNAIPSLDCVIVDRSLEVNGDTITKLCDFIRENNMMIFVSQNTRRMIGCEKTPSELTKIEKIDLGLSLYRKSVIKLAWYKRLINWFAKPFGAVPFIIPNHNVTLKMIKNRYGNEKSLDIFLDFKKINSRNLH